jgi:hypothetical protein
MNREGDWDRSNVDVAAPPRDDSASDPTSLYRLALKSSGRESLAAIARTLTIPNIHDAPDSIVESIDLHLRDFDRFRTIESKLSPAARFAVGLFSLTESSVWPEPAWRSVLLALGAHYGNVYGELAGFGIVARIDHQTIYFYDKSLAGVPKSGYAEYQNGLWDSRRRVAAHPIVLNAIRPTRPDDLIGNITLPAVRSVRLIREADGLEPILRLSAVWQRVDAEPPKKTQGGALFQRDRKRFEDDATLTSPPADEIEPIVDPARFWLEAARSVELIVDEPDGDRLLPARYDFWEEHAVHLPRLIPLRKLTPAPLAPDAKPDADAWFPRLAVLFWLESLKEDEWTTIEDLAAALTSAWPDWRDQIPARSEASDRSTAKNKPSYKPKAAEPKPKTKRKVERDGQKRGNGDPGILYLQSLLLGEFYQLGLIRAAEESPSGRRVVQPTPLARYILTLGPPPEPRRGFDQFLVVQPNFEMIAYRQGLTPRLIGDLGRFARWIRLGAAIELKLTAESIYLGLESGLTAAAIERRLETHSGRPIPPGVSAAITTWASRRDRLTYHPAATLLEFAATEDLEHALEAWRAADKPPPDRVGDRLLLVEEESSIPYHLFRQIGSRDYRKPAEACIEVETDGVTLSLDLSRTDLLIDAELRKIADPVASIDDPAGIRRTRFRITPRSIARAFAEGLYDDQIDAWFQRRAGRRPTPAVRLLLYAARRDLNDERRRTLTASIRYVLTAPRADLIDGLLQHPATRDHLGERLGDSSIVVPRDGVEPLRSALAELGLELEIAETG